VVFFSAFVDESGIRNPANLHNELELLLLIVSREDGFSCKELCQNTSQAPDVNFLCVRVRRREKP
jgi:hypothetical protein